MDLQKSKLTLINGPDSPRRQRAINFLQNLGRRLGRTFQNDLIYNSEEDLRTTSTNIDAFSLNEMNNEQHLDKTSIHNSSCDISSNNSEINNNHTKLLTNKKFIQSGLSVTSSVSRVLQNLSQFSTIRSNSCTNTPLKKQQSTNTKTNNINTKNSCNNSKTKQQEQPQRILRKPVNYVYLKGMSGLPTRRVPRSALCCNYLPR